MRSLRFRRRLTRHHAPLLLLSTAALVAVYLLVETEQRVARASMATAYVGLALLGASLATGALNVVRRRPNPVSTDLRRDIGIWAGIVSLLHVAFGLQVHMKYRYEYWLHALPGSDGLTIRTDLFGFANHTGLIATLIAVLLLALSNDRSLRTLGTPRWKALQRWNYALFALVLLHGVAYQVSEKRELSFVVAFGALLLPVVVLQAAGYRARRRAVRARVTGG